MPASTGIFGTQVLGTGFTAGAILATNTPASNIQGFAGGLGLQARVTGVLNAAGTTTVFAYPAVPEVVSPLLAVVPLQLLAVFTAELRGTDPDSFREDEPLYQQATASYRL